MLAMRSSSVRTGAVADDSLRWSSIACQADSFFCRASDACCAAPAASYGAIDAEEFKAFLLEQGVVAVKEKEKEAKGFFEQFFG